MSQLTKDEAFKLLYEGAIIGHYNFSEDEYLEPIPAKDGSFKVGVFKLSGEYACSEEQFFIIRKEQSSWSDGWFVINIYKQLRDLQSEFYIQVKDNTDLNSFYDVVAVLDDKKEIESFITDIKFDFEKGSFTCSTTKSVYKAKKFHRIFSNMIENLVPNQFILYPVSKTPNKKI